MTASSRATQAGTDIKGRPQPSVKLALSIVPGPFFALLRAMFREYGDPDTTDEEKADIKAQFERSCADMCATWEQLRAAIARATQPQKSGLP